MYSTSSINVKGLFFSLPIHSTNSKVKNVMFFNMLIHHRQSLLPFTSNKSSALLQNSS